VKHHFETAIYNGLVAAAEMWRGGRGWTLVAVSAGWFLSMGVRTIYPALVPYFQTDLGMSLTTAGLLLTVLWLAYAFGQFPAGLFGDRYGEGNVLVFSTILSTAAVIAVAASVNVTMFFVATIGLGFATSLFGPLRFVIFTEIFPDRTGTAVGFTMAAGNVGNSVLPVIAGILASYATWRLGFGLVIPLFAGVTVLMWATVSARDSASPEGNDGLTLQSIRQILAGIRQNGIPVVVGIQVLLGVAYQGFVSFYPTYLTEVKGFSPGLAATLIGLYFGCAIVLQPLSGAVQDWIGAKRTLLGIVAAFFLGLSVLPLVEGLGPIIALTVFLSSRTGTGVINNTFLVKALPTDVQSSGLGLLRTGWISVGALSPLALGALGDRGALEEGFLLLAVVVGLALVLIFFVPSLE